MNKDTKKIAKNIIMMILLAITLIAATYAWMAQITHSDIGNMDFFADDNLNVTFWDYNTASELFDIPINDGDLKLTGLKPGDSKTVRIRLERTSAKDKGIYIKVTGVKATGSSGSALAVITKGGIGYNIASFISADIMTVTFGGVYNGTKGGPLGTTLESITITQEPIPFDRTEESLIDAFNTLKLVENYPWPTDGSDYEVMYLDMIINILESRNVTGGSISITSLQKQKLIAGQLNVQAVSIE